MGVTVSLAGTLSAKADPARDLQVATKAFDFLDPKPGSGRIAVVYDDASRAAAEALAAAMPTSTNTTTLEPVLVSIADTAAVQSADSVLLPADFGAAADVAALMAGTGRLCFTTEKAFVEAGHCVMAVSSAPKVEIVVSAAAASANGIGFAGAFLMMITEI